MDEHKFTTISHAFRSVLSPISLTRLDQVVDLMELRPDARVLDLGCGKGEALIRTVERWDCYGYGVDHNPSFIAGARAEASTRLPEGRCTFDEADVLELDLEHEAYDAVICIGGRPWGDYEGTLEHLWKLVRTGGQVLIGEGYWRKAEPDWDFLDLLGCGPNAYLSHAENITLAVQESFTPTYFAACTEGEIEHYEALQLHAIERYLRANPNDEDAGEIKAQARAWRDGYLKWGKDNLGFALYLLLK